MVSKGITHDFSAESDNWSAHIYEMKTQDNAKIKRYLELFYKSNQEVKDLKCNIIKDNYCLAIRMPESTNRYKVEIVRIYIDEFTPEDKNYKLIIHWNGQKEELKLKCE